MDSFYEAPRRNPAPSASARFLPLPEVPEASLIRNHAPINNYMPYSAWKASTRPERGKDPLTLPSINNANLSQLGKKQVRFESPPQQKGFEPVLPKKTEIGQQLVGNGNNVGNVFGTRNFGDIYMANVPNRHLDLSVIDVRPQATNCQRVEQDCKVLRDYNSDIKNRKEEMPKSYKEFLDLQSKSNKENIDNCVTDILNYKREVTPQKQQPVMRNYTEEQYEKPYVNENFMPTAVPHQQEIPFVVANNQNQCKCCHNKCNLNPQTSQELVKSDPEEPTVKDLLKIISQQNEQLIQLQKQVSTLLSSKEPTQRQIEPPNMFQKDISTPRKGPLSKFSIDLMTSFEVSIRPQNNPFSRPKDYINYEPKIQEITETETVQSDKTIDRKAVDASLQIPGELQIQERCPSPEPSIKITMNDFDSSEEEDEVSSIGESFYKNLMGQVNNILKNAEVEGSDSGNNRTMRKVKETTLKHLRSIGVSVPSFEDSYSSSSSEGDRSYSPIEISFAVKQLLMKYLPDDQLARIKAKKKRDKEMNVGSLLPNRPEFSIATVQYMKKYNLIQGKEKAEQDFGVKKNPQLGRLQKDTPKILDISALKQQPKLL